MSDIIALKKMEPKSNGNIGRPTVFTEDVIRKIEEVAALDGSVEEMAFYAGIEKGTLYKKLESDKDFFYKIDRLRQRPILAARQRVILGITESYQNAMDFLKRKRRKEFGDRQEIDQNLNVNFNLTGLLRAAREYKENGGVATEPDELHTGRMELDSSTPELQLPEGQEPNFAAIRDIIRDRESSKG